MNLTGEQLDALQELINIGLGRAASVLNEMLSSHIRLQVPLLKLLSLSDVQAELRQQLGTVQVSATQIKFTGAFLGTAMLIFPRDSAAKLVSVLIDEEHDLPDLDALKIGTLSEVGNIILNGVMGSISNLLDQCLRYSLPLYLEEQTENLLMGDLEGDPMVLLARTRFTSDRLMITGDILLVFKVGSFDTLLLALDSKLGVS